MLTLKTHYAFFLDLEVLQIGQRGIFIPPHIRADDEILLFIKLNDFEQDEASFVGRMFLKSYLRIDDVIEFLKKSNPVEEGRRVQLYKDKTTNVVLPGQHTLATCEFVHGDIVVMEVEENVLNKWLDA
ncbi:putative ubiquitin carboxyl-terminal hydrolase 7, ICP0-binding domain-containing protein [Helianthus anomalus]